MILREQEYNIKPFRKVKIGDPIYFEAIENGADEGCEKELVCDLAKIPFSNREAKVVLRENEDEYEGFKYKTLEILFATYKKTELAKKIFEAHRYKQWYPDLCKENKHLGCDTAQFEITIDDNYDVINTGADGYYGEFYHYKNNDAYIFSFSLDEDLFSWEDVEEKIKYLFNIK